MHDFVAGRQYESLARERIARGCGALGQQSRLPARAVEVRHADVEIPDCIRPSRRPVDAVSARPGFVSGTFRIHEWLGTQAPLPPRVGPLAKPRQHVEIERAPVADESEVDQRLADLVLAVDVLHQVRLVDDVDELVGLGDAPEHAADADPKLGLVEHPLVQQLPHVEARAPAVGRIEPQKRREQQALPVVVERVIELGLHGEREAVAFLARMFGRVHEAARFDLHATAHLERVER